MASDHWNRGIATESSRCLIGYAFENLGFRTVEASTEFSNAASIRVLEKLGMLLQRREVVDVLDTVFYRVSRDNWENAS